MYMRKYTIPAPVRSGRSTGPVAPLPHDAHKASASIAQTASPGPRSVELVSDLQVSGSSLASIRNWVSKLDAGHPDCGCRYEHGQIAARKLGMGKEILLMPVAKKAGFQPDGRLVLE
jgi:hypothetical protein